MCANTPHATVAVWQKVEEIIVQLLDFSRKNYDENVAALRGTRKPLQKNAGAAGKAETEVHMKNIYERFSKNMHISIYCNLYS